MAKYTNDELLSMDKSQLIKIIIALRNKNSNIRQEIDALFGTMNQFRNRANILDDLDEIDVIEIHPDV